MKPKTNASVNKVQAFISLNKSLKVLAYNDAAKSFFLNSLNVDFEIDLYFPDLFKVHSLPIKEKLEKAFKGNMEMYDISSEEFLYEPFRITISPVIEENDSFSKLSVSIVSLVTADDFSSQQEPMLRAIIDNLPDYIFVKNREHKSVLSNRKFRENILKEDKREAGYGLTPLDYFEDEKGKAIIADNEKVMRTGKPVINRPDIVINKKGEEERVLLTKVPLKNEENEITGLVGIARDVTTNYKQEKKKELILKIIKSFGDSSTLREAMEETLRLLCTELGFDYAEAYKISMNKNNLIRTAFWPLDQDLSGKDDYCTYEMGDGLPGQVWEEKELKAINHRTGLLKNMLFDGEKPLKSAVGFPVVYKNKIVSILCFGAIEENKEIETQFLKEVSIQIASVIESKKSQDQLSDFFHYSLNLIAVVGLDGFIKMVNPSFEYKFGYSKDELLSLPFIEFIHPDDLEKVLQAMNELEVPKSKFEIRCRKKDGSYLWISWRFSRFFEDENVVYVFGTDITPLKKAYDELSAQIFEKEKVQDKLQLSEEKYRSLFDVSSLPMWVLDREQLRFLSVNQAAVDLYGYSREEFLKMKVQDLWAPNQEKRINKIVEENHDDFFKVKVKHITKAGNFLYVIVKSNPLTFDGIKARVSLVNDVTAMVKAEEKLQNSEKRFKALVQEGSDLISIVDCQYNYIYNSPASQWVFGLVPLKIKGTNFRDYIHKDDIGRVDEFMAYLKTSKRVQLPSYRIKNVDGEWRWIETIVTNLKDEEAVGGIVMNSRDITEFVEQERKLIDSVKRYDIVAKATTDIITDYDIEKDKVTINEAASKMLGFTAEEIGKNGAWWDEKIHPADYKYVKELSQKMIEERIKNLTIEYRFRCKDGSYKHILDRSYLLTDKNNIPKRIIGSMQDITERKKYLIEIENHNKRLKEIAWTQSHVVRAPLAKVMGLVDLLINYKDDLGNVDELLENILNSANELDEIIRKIAVQTEEQL
ncbi:PAS domain S-box protein [Gramella jeungdoensis]|uniref:histidine kinase n=1 Tax=Gramella jeungdoensis TaxID=708091 RepID=A0ABT0Z4Y0_9FLAO|nr:PAS domain S-box protein [Gramella jeungdoensis]MCM8570463.1 PAS domain S-box protein [Gramella jeungdoensis]